MSTGSTYDIVVPPLGESVTEATIARWLKNVGDSVAIDEPLVELETDKVTLEVNASQAGVLADIKAQVGDVVEIGNVIGVVGEGQGQVTTSIQDKPRQDESLLFSANQTADETSQPVQAAASAPVAPQEVSNALSPAVKKMLDEHNINPNDVPATGKDGRLLKGDVLSYIERNSSVAKVSAPSAVAPSPAPTVTPAPVAQSATARGGEERVPMTRLRKRIAERLKDAQNTAAMLTTFNEVDMTNVMEARKQYKDAFEKKHKIKLGFMSFFVKAAILALKEIPAVNAEIDGDDLVYKNHYDIGVAVSTPTGLVVPVVRDADQMTFAGVEQSIVDLGLKAREGKLTMQDMTGGTFTITNGGVFGSLMSTPILNPPQSGILGMHKIQKRPMVVEGDKIEVRPMMYLALTYDHRIIDGREAVTFLVRIKECIENPERILLDV